MKWCIKLAFGAVVFYFAVYQPLKVNLICALATKTGLDLNGQTRLLDWAQSLDPCNSDIANTLGDTFLKAKSPFLAGVIYGKAIPCSPGRAELRFKFGEMLLAQGTLDGFYGVKEALMLEPHNPVYKAEVERVTKLRQQSQ